MKTISQLVWKHWKGWLLMEALQEMVVCLRQNLTGWPGICYIDQADLELTDIHLPVLSKY